MHQKLHTKNYTLARRIRVEEEEGVASKSRRSEVSGEAGAKGVSCMRLHEVTLDKWFSSTRARGQSRASQG